MKYIIEIPDEVEWGVVTCRTEDGFFTRDFDSLEELNSDYINEHYGDLQDVAYHKGINEGYQRGLEDSKAVNDKGCEGCKYAGKVVTGPPCISCCNSYKNQWQAKQTDDEIKVGDEVRNKINGLTYTVTLASESGYVLLDSDGNFGTSCITNSFEKTGNHFDIASILKEMQND